MDKEGNIAGYRAFVQQASIIGKHKKSEDNLQDRPWQIVVRPELGATRYEGMTKLAAVLEDMLEEKLQETLRQEKLEEGTSQEDELQTEGRTYKTVTGKGKGMKDIQNAALPTKKRGRPSKKQPNLSKHGNSDNPKIVEDPLTIPPLEPRESAQLAVASQDELYFKTKREPARSDMTTVKEGVQTKNQNTRKKSDELNEGHEIDSQEGDETHGEARLNLSARLLRSQVDASGGAKTKRKRSAEVEEDTVSKRTKGAALCRSLGWQDNIKESIHQSCTERDYVLDRNRSTA